MLLRREQPLEDVGSRSHLITVALLFFLTPPRAPGVHLSVNCWKYTPLKPPDGSSVLH